MHRVRYVHMGIYNLITLPCKNVVIIKSNYCSWLAWPWRQRHYNPLKCWLLLTQQHNSTVLQTGIYSIQDSCWSRILTSYVWDVTVCSFTGADVWGEGITSNCMAYPDYTPSACKVITLLHGFTCFCTVLRYFYQHMSLYILFTSFSSLPNASTVNIQFIF